jgi:hypothetical protein
VTDLQIAARAHEDYRYVDARGPQPNYVIPVSTIAPVNESLNRQLPLEAAGSSIAQ